MSILEILLVGLVFIIIITIPFLKKFIVFQFVSLVVVVFIVGSLFNEIYRLSRMNIQSIILLLLLIGGLVFNSIKFYKNIIAK